MSIPTKIIKITRALYTNPTFCVEMNGSSSSWTKQETGIRQGCPLSPYLFLIVMTAMFHDIHKDDGVGTLRQRLDGTDSDEVVYADDTICIAQTNAAMNRMLSAIETEGKRYGLKLNKKKCEYMKFGDAGTVKFADGTHLKPVEEVKYLGCLLNDKGDPAKEVKKRIAEVTITLKRLDLYFRMGDASIKEKLSIFNAVLRSKLMYGLESLVMVASVLNRLDAFQLKGLRKILGKQTTYYNRTYSNEYLYQLANEHLSEHGCKIIKLSEYHKERRMVLLAKLIVMRDKEPSAKITLDGSGLANYDLKGKRRYGRPRLNWLSVTLLGFWEEAKQENGNTQQWTELDTNDDGHMRIINELADKYNKKYKFTGEELEEFGPFGEEAPCTPVTFGPHGHEHPETPPRDRGNAREDS